MNAAEGSPDLSFRQQQILECLIKGYHNKTIATYLGIEVVTVKMHIGVLFKKLGVSNRTEAAVRGLELYAKEPEPASCDLPERKRRFGTRRASVAPRSRPMPQKRTA
ncbi:MAG TPA: helix-turn-helix transcriptional regulator [Stellaceae bacterium]